MIIPDLVLVLQISGSGSFGHETNTRKAAHILVLPRPEEGIACSILHEGGLVQQSILC